MTMQSAASRPLFEARAEGGSNRRAAATLDRHAVEISNSIRRAIPFLGRRSIAVAPKPTIATSIATIANEAEGPTFILQLITDPGGLRGALILDGRAISFLLDGVLGGSTDGEPPKLADDLSSPQAVLVRRLAQMIATGIEEPVLTGVGFRMVELPAVRGEEPADAAVLATCFFLGDEAQHGRLWMAVAKDAIGTSSAGPRATGVDPKMAAAVDDVEIDLVAELGRLTMPISRLMRLRVGDMLRLDVAVGGTIQIRTSDEPILYAQPTTSGAQLAVRIVGPATASGPNPAV